MFLTRYVHEQSKTISAMNSKRKDQCTFGSTLVLAGYSLDATSELPETSTPNGSNVSQKGYKRE